MRKSNKENNKSVCGPRKQVISTTVSKQRVLCKSAPLHSKNDGKEDNSGKGEKDVRPKTSTNDANHQTKRNTLSQAFRTQQSVRTRKLVEEVQKQPSTVVQKSKPGTYKGRVVQSKIDCFRKPSGDVKTTENKLISKPDLTKAKSELTKVRSKSVTSLPASTRPTLNAAFQSRPKSVSDVPQHIADKTVQKSVFQKPIPLKVPGSIRPAGPRQVRAPPRPAPLTTGRLVTRKPIASKKNEAVVQRAKPKPAVTTTEQKICRPVTSTVSKYRVQMETADERRAKLAEWMASKGKTVKRPPVSETLPTNSHKPAPLSKPGPKATSIAVTQPESVKPTSEMKIDNQTDDIEAPENKPVQSNSSSNIMNTTLDLLDNSDMDLPVDPEIRMESLVLNLCDKLEAMETPSSCTDGTEVDKADELECERMEVQVEEQETDKVFEILEEEVLEEGENCKEAAVKHEDKKTKDKMQYEDEDSEDSEEETGATSPEMEGASIVKYSVKTTPYLQSVKKRIECQSASGSGSRHKSTIKDLKFLTPVRRSTRIQRKSSRLPGMLNDHDTCVSSLAELVQLEDADASAYIYRKNPALLEDLPDHSGDIGKVCS